MFSNHLKKIPCFVVLLLNQDDSVIRVIYIEEFFERGWKDVIEKANPIVGPEPASLIFDVDGLDLVMVSCCKK